MAHEKTVDQILSEKVIPAVAIDEHGLFTYINKAFEETYGWKRHDLLGQLITKIIPPYMRDAHNFGFSRFLTTEISKIQGKPLKLPVYCKDGRVIEAEHYIVGEKVNGKWRFAATIMQKTIQ